MNAGSKGQCGIFSALDPRTRILCALAFSIITACLQNICAAILALGVGFACLAPQWRTWSAIARKLAAVNVFMLFIWLVTPFTMPGPAIWQWHFLKLSWTGIMLSSLVTIKGNALAAIFIALISPISPMAMDMALSRLHCPDKLILILVLLERNIHLLHMEWHALFTAARLRGFSPATSLHTYRTYASLLAILLIRANERANRLRDALLLKGFSGHFPFSGNMRFGWKDAIFAIATLGACALLHLVETGFVHVPCKWCL